MENEKQFYKISKQLWDNVKYPAERYTSIKKVKYFDLVDMFKTSDISSFESIVRDLTEGAILIIQNCFDKDEIEFIKNIGKNLMNSEESSFHKLDRKIPNFWRDITEEHSNKYGVPVVKKTAYFFQWNHEKELFDLINPRWDVCKLLSGQKSSYGKYTTPEDGVIDRIQVVEYPGGTGYLAPHQDPDHNQKCFISAYAAKIGEDFKSGGFWALNENDQKVNLEHELNIGDMGLGCARIVHGVDQIDKHKTSKRWWFGLYTNDSDLVKNRITLESPKLNIQL